MAGLKTSVPALSAAVKATENLGYDIYKVEDKLNPGKNIVISPLSAETILALTLLGASGETAAEMAKVLHLPNDRDTVLTGFEKLMTSFKSNDVVMRIANKLFVNNKIPLKANFMQLAQKQFQAEAENVDYKQEVEALKIINDWVAQKTENKISSILDKAGPNTLVVLVNAIYFNGKWNEPFKLQSYPMEFHVDKNTVIELPALHKKSYYQYYEDDRMQIVEIPYKGEEFSLVIVLPREIDGLKSIEDQFPIDLSKLQRQEVEVTIPKFKLEATVELTDILQNLGMKLAFDRCADFSNLSDVPAYISKVVQKCFIDVNEEGTEAAAATAAYGRMCSKLVARKSKQFNANQPFLFIISHWLYGRKYLLIAGHFYPNESTMFCRNIFSTTSTIPLSSPALVSDLNLFYQKCLQRYKDPNVSPQIKNLLRNILNVTVEDSVIDDEKPTVPDISKLIDELIDNVSIPIRTIDINKIQHDDLKYVSINETDDTVQEIYNYLLNSTDFQMEQASDLKNNIKQLLETKVIQFATDLVHRQQILYESNINSILDDLVDSVLDVADQNRFNTIKSMLNEQIDDILMNTTSALMCNVTNNLLQNAMEKFTIVQSIIDEDILMNVVESIQPSSSSSLELIESDQSAVLNEQSITDEDDEQSVTDEDDTLKSIKQSSVELMEINEIVIYILTMIIDTALDQAHEQLTCSNLLLSVPTVVLDDGWSTPSLITRKSTSSELICDTLTLCETHSQVIVLFGEQSEFKIPPSEPADVNTVVEVKQSSVNPNEAMTLLLTNILMKIISDKMLNLSEPIVEEDDSIVIKEIVNELIDFDNSDEEQEEIEVDTEKEIEEEEEEEETEDEEDEKESEEDEDKEVEKAVNPQTVTVEYFGTSSRRIPEVFSRRELRSGGTPSVYIPPELTPKEKEERIINALKEVDYTRSTAELMIHLNVQSKDKKDSYVPPAHIPSNSKSNTLKVYSSSIHNETDDNFIIKRKQQQQQQPYHPVLIYLIEKTPFTELIRKSGLFAQQNSLMIETRSNQLAVVVQNEVGSNYTSSDEHELRVVIPSTKSNDNNNNNNNTKSMIPPSEEYYETLTYIVRPSLNEPLILYLVAPDQFNRKRQKTISNDQMTDMSRYKLLF